MLELSDGSTETFAPRKPGKAARRLKPLRRLKVFDRFTSPGVQPRRLAALALGAPATESASASAGTSQIPLISAMLRQPMTITNPRTGQTMTFVTTREELLEIETVNPPTDVPEPEHVHRKQKSGCRVGGWQ